MDCQIKQHMIFCSSLNVILGRLSIAPVSVLLQSESMEHFRHDMFKHQHRTNDAQMALHIFEEQCELFKSPDLPTHLIYCTLCVWFNNIRFRCLEITTIVAK